MPSSTSAPALLLCLLFATPALAHDHSDESQTPAPVPRAAEGTDDAKNGAADPPHPITVGQPAQQPALAGADEKIGELKRQLDILAAEVEKLRSGEPETVELTPERRRSLGLAPSAAATYRRKTEGVSLAGYGEMLLENFADENQAAVSGNPASRIDFLRAILYAGYRFSDKFLFNSEIEVEHADEISVEFAYVDYMVTPNLTLRGGMMLLPLGLTNEFHEPTVYIGAKRPETERRILPSTWRENGGGVLGSFGKVNFRAYIVNGMKASGFTSAGVRGGRQGGGEALAANWAFTGRVDATLVPGVFGGIGVYRGGSGQNEVRSASGSFVDVGTTIAEVHGQAQARGFDLRALYARASVDDAPALNAALRTAINAPVAERMTGGYVQAGYNVLSQRDTRLSVMPFVRYEQVDTQDRVPAGYRRDLSRDGRLKTLGVEVKPLPNVVLKADYQWITNEARSGRNQFNVNLGYAF